MSKVALRHIITATLGLGMIASMAQAKVSLNAACYMNTKDNKKTIVGDQADKEFELASTSKVVTSFWAITKLGATYRYETKINITPASNDSYDVHISGSKDPYFGREMTYFLVSELNKAGVKKIENLTFDERFEINWNVRDLKFQSQRSYDPKAETVRQVIVANLIDTKISPEAYSNMRASAKRNFNLDLVNQPNLSIRRVAYKSADQFKNEKDDRTKTLSLHSAPLYRYLKEMNLHSNNYVADMVFGRLGGPEDFKKFIQEKLQLDNTDVSFVNGSGDSVYTDSGKLYNKASCSTMVKILFAMRQELQEQGLDLKDVMSVAGADNSTLGGRYADLSNSVVAKTGSVNPGITLAGMLSTDRGDLMFAVLMKTDGPADWTNARNRIRSEVNKMIKANEGADKFKYSAAAFLPFDSKSILSSDVDSKQN